MFRSRLHSFIYLYPSSYPHDYCMLFCLVLFYCSASIIFMVWTTKKFRMAECQSVSTHSQTLVFTLHIHIAPLIGILTGFLGWPEFLPLSTGLDGAVGRWCLLEVSVLHHTAGHHVSMETIHQQPKVPMGNKSFHALMDSPGRHTKTATGQNGPLCHYKAHLSTWSVH